MKIIYRTLCIFFAMIFLFAGCKVEFTGKTADPDVTVLEIEPSVGEDSVDWANAENFDVLKLCPIIIKGTVLGVREVELTYLDDSWVTTSHMTLLDIEIEEVFYGDAELVGQTLTFGIWVIFQGLPPEVPFPADGESVIVFAEPLTEANDSLGLSELGVADCYVNFANDLFISCENASQEKLARVFKILSSNFNASYVDEDYVSDYNTYTLSDLEAYLRAKCK